MSSTCPPTLPSPPTLEEVRTTAELLHGRVARTPVLDWAGPEIAARVLPGTSINLKLELFQHTGSFKARGALAVMLAAPQVTYLAGTVIDMDGGGQFRR